MHNHFSPLKLLASDFQLVSQICPEPQHSLAGLLTLTHQGSPRTSCLSVLTCFPSHCNCFLIGSPEIYLNENVLLMHFFPWEFSEAQGALRINSNDTHVPLYPWKPRLFRFGDCQPLDKILSDFAGLLKHQAPISNIVDSFPQRNCSLPNEHPHEYYQFLFLILLHSLKFFFFLF